MTTVRFYVWSEIDQEIERKEGESEEELIQRAIEKAMEEQPKVYWMTDEGIEAEIKED
jgi:hypothetical protein